MARFLVRRLPEPLMQMDYGLETYYEVQYEMWDTWLNKRAGPAFGRLFADERTAQGFADKWNFVEGPPKRCGSCGKELAEGEAAYGHGFYRLLCFACSCAQEE